MLNIGGMKQGRIYFGDGPIIFRRKIGQNDIFVSTRPIFDNLSSLTQNGRMQPSYWEDIYEILSSSGLAPLQTP